MTVRNRFMLSAALALGLTRALTAQEPSRLDVVRGAGVNRPEQSANQQIANTIADHLRQSGQLRGYHIDIIYQNGTAELVGRVADQPQMDEVVRIAQGIPGVERVRNNLTTMNSIIQTQAPMPAVPAPTPLPKRALDPNVPAPIGPAEPMPIAPGGMGGPYDLNPPQMPPYAWPTYAPYNNYSRVAYPLAYPYNSWPFIGPCYPFPKIPLGWRSVKLEWQDGHWWFSKTATKFDWWRLRYW